MEKNHTTQESTTKIYNAVISLTKTFENVTGNYPVAGFVLRIGSGHSWDSYKYYKNRDLHCRDKKRGDIIKDVLERGHQEAFRS